MKCRIKNHTITYADSIYVTNQPAIVKHAKYCQINHPTVVNNIPQEKNIYDNSMDSFAAVDNRLAESQLGIGMSANLAQIALGYTYSFDNRKYYDCVCILAVLSQVCIDSAKKSYDMDLIEEIKRLKALLDIDINKYPAFWLNIRKGFKKSRINCDLVCPMNYLNDIKIPKSVFTKDTIPISAFFKKFELKEHPRKSLKVEKLIQDYSFKIYTAQNVDDLDEIKTETYLLLRDDFDKLIEDLRSTYISNNYVGFMSWLINRAFFITSGVKSTKKYISSRTNNNRAILLKTLYEINPDAFLLCFSKNIGNR